MDDNYRKLVSALQDAADCLSGYADVRDGSDGRPLPNYAMRVQMDIESLLRELGEEV